MKRTEQSGDAVEVVAVKMPDEDRMDPTSLYTRAHQLQLRAFAAVEQKHVAITDERGGRQPSRECRDGRTGS